MKRIIGLLLAVIMVIALSSCGENGTVNQTSNNQASNGTGDVIYGDNEEETTKPKVDTAELAKKVSVTKYFYNSGSYYYAVLILKNNSDYTIDVQANVEFVNGQNQTVGAKDESENDFVPNSEICMAFSCDTKFTDIKYEIIADVEEYYVPVDNNLSLDVSIVNNNKAVIKATNNGDINAEFATVTCLFFNNDKLVDCDYTYVVDNDSELKAGASKTVEINSYENFDSVTVYIHGRADQ